ncbi:MAG: HD domain-containing protein [Alphaproteobacteria bacterium]|nr:HD domain-containing protein [Alphaproteobacteria bacterium]
MSLNAFSDARVRPDGAGSDDQLPDTFPALEPVLTHVRRALERLPDTLLYHDIHHTLRDVFPSAMLLAEREGCGPRERSLVGAAALFHDVGYLDRYKANEPLGAARARQVLPRFGFSDEDLDLIADMILATAVPQQPRSHLARILCDADLAHLGTDRFFLQSERLRLELSYQGVESNLRAWHESNLRFLDGHSFHTATAQAVWQPGKDRNRALVEELLGR